MKPRSEPLDVPRQTSAVIFPHMGWSCLICKTGLAASNTRCPFCMTESKNPIAQPKTTT